MAILLFVFFLCVFFFCVAVYACCCYNGDEEEFQSYDRSAVVSNIERYVIENADQVQAMARRAVILKGVIEKDVIPGINGSDNRKSNIHLEAPDTGSTRSRLAQSIRSFLSIGTTSSAGTNDTTNTRETESNLILADDETNSSKVKYSLTAPLATTAIPIVNANDGIGKKGDIQEGMGSKRRSLGNSFVDLRSSIVNSVRSSVSRTSKELVLYTPATCFICLEKYKVGDKIYWSKNDKCSHSFHSTCMMRWLFDNDDCPLCRENYVNIVNN